MPLWPTGYAIDDHPAANEIDLRRRALGNCYRAETIVFWSVAPDLPIIPRDRVGDLFCVLVTCWNGPHQEAEQVFKPLRDAAEVKAEAVDIVEGHFNDTPLAGLNWVGLYKWHGGCLDAGARLLRGHAGTTTPVY